jgi:hypothetical protein
VIVPWQEGPRGCTWGVTSVAEDRMSHPGARFTSLSRAAVPRKRSKPASDHILPEMQSRARRGNCLRCELRI